MTMEMDAVSAYPNEFVARQQSARVKELAKMSKLDLVCMHIENGGLMGYQEYAKWSKDELINTVLQDEAINSGA
jgi:hypothetical protein